MKWIFKIYLNQHNCPAKKVEPGEPAIASAGLSVERAQQPLQPAVTVIRGPWDLRQTPSVAGIGLNQYGIGLNRTGSMKRHESL